MAKAPVEDTTEKYPDGTPITRYPKWIYPGGKPQLSNDRKTTNGVLVQNKEEHDAYISEHPEFADEEAPKAKAKGWDK